MMEVRVIVFGLLASCSVPYAWVEGAFLEKDWAESDFGSQGQVVFVPEGVELGMGAPLVGIHWTGGAGESDSVLPRMDYELELEATRLAGSDFFCGLTFPVGENYLSLILGGWGGSLCGFSSLDGEDAAHNGSAVFRDFVPGRSYRLRVSVRADRVEAWLDEEPLTSVSLLGKSVDIRPEVLNSRPLGIASFQTRARVSWLRWKRLAVPAR